MRDTSTACTDGRFGLGSRKMLIFFYMTVAFLYWFSLYVYLPTLPTYAQSKSDNLALVGLALSMFGLWQAIARLPLGIATDWAGWRKPFIILGVILSGLGAWMMSAAADINWLIIGRTITGLAACTWVPLTVAYSDLFPVEEAVKAAGVFTFASSLGRLLATAVTGSLNELGGYPLPFFAAVGASALALILMLPAQEKRRPAKRPSLKGVGLLISNPAVLLPSLLGAISQYASWASAFSFTPILARQLGANAITQSMLMSVYVGMLTLGNLLSATIVHRVGPKRLIYLGFIMLSGGVLGTALAPTLETVFAAQFFVGLAAGGCYPVLMGLSIQQVSDSERTTAMGAHQAIYAVGMFVGPWLSGILADQFGIRPMLGITAFFCLSLVLLITRHVRPAKVRRDEGQERVDGVAS